MFGKLIVRGIGVVSTLILVRVLEPSDFGIIAIGIMLIGFFEVLSDAGVNRFLVLHAAPKDNDYNSAWTLNIIFRTTLLALLALLAPFSKSLFNNPELENVIWALCATQLFGSFKNIGLVKLEKELNYSAENRILICAKVVSFGFCIPAAFYFKNYLALLLGNFVNISIVVILSYVFCSFRPRLNFRFSPEIFTFSKFLFLRNIISYSRSQMDVLAVGLKFGETATGQFSIARQFSMMPQTELITPAIRPIFAGLTKFKDEPEKLKENVIQVLQACYLFLIPCAFGFLAIAEPFTSVVFGERWMPMADYIGMLAFLMAVFVLQGQLNIVYDAAGKIKYSIWADILGIASLSLLIIISKLDDVVDFAYIRIASGAIALISMSLMAKFYVGIRLLKIVEVILVPTVLSSIMYILILWASSFVQWVSVVWELLALIALGVAVYLLGLIFIVLLLKKLAIRTEVTELLKAMPFSLLSKGGGVK